MRCKAGDLVLRLTTHKDDYHKPQKRVQVVEVRVTNYGTVKWDHPGQSLQSSMDAIVEVLSPEDNDLAMYDHAVVTKALDCEYVVKESVTHPAPKFERVTITVNGQEVQGVVIDSITVDFIVDDHKLVPLEEDDEEGLDSIVITGTVEI